MRPLPIDPDCFGLGVQAAQTLLGFVVSLMLYTLLAVVGAKGIDTAIGYLRQHHRARQERKKAQAIKDAREAYQRAEQERADKGEKTTEVWS